MNAIEKAKELIDKMKLATDEFGYININKARHIKCAEIAINEILKALNDNIYIQGENDLDSHIKYWEEVKKNIDVM